MNTNQPNIVVVICHDLGRYVGCYGVTGVRSSNIDAFAASSLRFENSFCAAPQCSPSRAALWTGRYPHSNGVVGLAHSGFQNDLNPDERHLAQILSANGYETHLFGVQHEASSPERCGYTHTHPRGTCAQVATAFCDFLTQRKLLNAPLSSRGAQTVGPFFAQIGLFEPHRPFLHDVQGLDANAIAIPPYLPDIPEVRADFVDFEASIASIDQAFGRMLETLEAVGLAEHTLVVFTADHGIPFPRAKMSLYDPGIEVPLLMRIPGVPGGANYSEMISNVDFVPTILDMLRIDIPENVQGRSFWSLISGDEYTPRECVFAEKTYHTYYDPMRAIRTNRWKLVANFEFAPAQETPPDYANNAKGYPEISRAMAVPYTEQYHPAFELFDLAHDPWEQNNLAEDPDHAEIRDDLARQLRDWMTKTEDPLLTGPVPQGAYINRMKAFRGI